MGKGNQTAYESSPPTNAIIPIDAGHHLRSDAERATRLAHPVQRRRGAAATGGRTGKRCIQATF